MISRLGDAIPSDKNKEIFDEFRQLSNSGRAYGEGWRLDFGLAIVSHLDELPGAKLEVTSQVKRDSRFSLYLPFNEGERPAAAAQATPPSDAGGRVLIIEDDPMIRMSLEALLDDWGYETLAAETGQRALMLAARAKWRLDMVLADYRLGTGLTGVETAKEIASQAGHAFPTLVLTGDTAKERVAEIAASGFEMLHKPVAADILRQKLAQLMSS